jgi:hypothetical protein
MCASPPHSCKRKDKNVFLVANTYTIVEGEPDDRRLK